MQVHNYEKLIVWEKSMDLVIFIYGIIKIFPKTEIYGLTSQIKRSAISIPSNIAEGSRRSTKKDFAHFLVIAFGSASELDTQIKIAFRLKFIKENQYEEVSKYIYEIMKMLNKLIETNK